MVGVVQPPDRGAAMIRIAYRSRAVQPDLALLALAQIIAVSDRNNRRDEVTGALMVSAGAFSRCSKASLRTLIVSCGAFSQMGAMSISWK
jgi:Sensors of blue-light using FAD